MHKVQCGSRVIMYQLTRKPVKNINLRVKMEGTVHISAHKKVPIAYIEEFIKQKQDWLIKALEKCKRQQEKQPTQKHYVEGETHTYLGKQFILSIVESSEEWVLIKDGIFILQVRNEQDVKRKEKIWNNWMKKERELVFHEIAQEVYPLFRDYQIAYPTIKSRRMKARWGTCQYKNGIVILNSRLIEKPREYIKYVVVHEFAHFVCPNHSKEFYRVVESVMPNWKGIVTNDKKEQNFNN